ncbi:unnamed protein product, partial [Sphacelaria rigidula]
KTNNQKYSKCRHLSRSRRGVLHMIRCGRCDLQNRSTSAEQNDDHPIPSAFVRHPPCCTLMYIALMIQKKTAACARLAKTWETHASSSSCTSNECPLPSYRLSLAGLRLQANP